MTQAQARYYIAEKRSRNGKFIRSSTSYPTLEAALAMRAELDEHGGCGPMRIEDTTGAVVA